MTEPEVRSLTDDLQPVLVAGSDPSEGLVGARSDIVEDEHDGSAVRAAPSSASARHLTTSERIAP